MRPQTSDRQSLLLIGVMALAFSLTTIGSLIYYVIQDQNAIHYPDALRVSDGSLITAYPVISMKRTTSYRTDDTFLDVYNYYSGGFDLGAEKQAQSTCSHLFDSFSRFRMTRTMSVTLCDTPNGRLIFVQQTTSFRLRR